MSDRKKILEKTVKLRMAGVRLEDMKLAIGADTISKRGAVITIRKEFFYRHGGSAEKMVDRVRALFPAATILDSGDIWKPFRGGASVAQSSHWFVKFELPEEAQ